MNARWTLEEEKKLISAVKKGGSLEIMAKEFGRSENALELRIKKIIYDTVAENKPIDLIAKSLKITEDKTKQYFYSYKEMLEKKGKKTIDLIQNEGSQKGSEKGSQKGSEKGSQKGSDKGSKNLSKKESQKGSEKGSKNLSKKESQKGSEKGSKNLSKKESQKGSQKGSEKGSKNLSKNLSHKNSNKLNNKVNLERNKPQYIDINKIKKQNEYMMIILKHIELKKEINKLLNGGKIDGKNNEKLKATLKLLFDKNKK
jgi:hypothetical protein